MAQLPIEEGLNRFKENEDKFDSFVNGDGYISTDGQFVESVFDAVQTIKAFNPTGARVTGQHYVLKDLYVDANIAYVVVVAEFVSVSSAVDLANGHVSVFQGLTALDLGSNSGASIVKWRRTAEGAFISPLSMLMDSIVSVFEFFTEAQRLSVSSRDGLQTVAANANKAILFCDQTGRTLHFPAGRYVLEDSLLKPGSFTAPIMIGSGSGSDATGTVLEGSFNGPLVKIVGGSGSQCVSYMQSFTFKALGVGKGTGVAANRTTCLEVASQDGWEVRDSLFLSGYVGMHYNNIEGGFTEYVMHVNCTFQAEVRRKIVYTRNGGTD